MLALALWLLAVARTLAFWAHDPMLAYGNNFDQVRAMQLLRVAPDKPPGLGVPFEATPHQPWRWFRQLEGEGQWVYPSSDLLLKQGQRWLAGWFGPGGGLHDIRQWAALPLALWLCGMLWAGWRLWRASRWHGLAFAAWVLLIADPVNLLFLNTLYAEFSAFAACTGLAALGWLWLAGCCRRPAALACGWLLLLTLATNRNQYMYLPLLLAPLALLAAWRWPALRRWRAGLALAAGLAAAVPLLLYGPQPGQLRDTASVNRVNTVMGAMLPAASHPARMLQRLKLPPACQRFSGQTWYATPADAYRQHCPQLLAMPLPRMALALAADPLALGRMVMTAGRQHQGFVQTHLGQVQGQHHMAAQALGTPLAWSFDTLLRALPNAAWQGLLAAALLLPWPLSLAAARRRLKGWALAMAALGLGIDYVFFSSLLGDGYFEIERHAVLCYSLGCLLLLAAPALLWRLAWPSPSKVETAS